MSKTSSSRHIRTQQCVCAHITQRQQYYQSTTHAHTFSDRSQEIGIHSAIAANAWNGAGAAEIAISDANAVLAACRHREGCREYRGVRDALAAHAIVVVVAHEHHRAPAIRSAVSGHVRLRRGIRTGRDAAGHCETGPRTVFVRIRVAHLLRIVTTDCRVCCAFNMLVQLD